MNSQNKLRISLYINNKEITYYINWLDASGDV